MTDIQTQSTPASPLAEFMRRADAARYLRDQYAVPCAPTTLAKYACIGGGPAFHKAGKFPIYSRDDLDTWARSRISETVHSTSALSAKSGGYSN